MGDLRMLDRDPADDLIDIGAVRRYRLARVREEMTRHGVDACVLFDPVNIRYATDARNMQIFTSRNPARYLFLPLDGPVILYEFAGAEHLGEGLETIDEVRTALTASFVAAGDEIASRERLWARAMAADVRRHCGSRATVGIERVNAGAAIALAGEGFTVVDAQQPVERARAVKSGEELKCITSSLRATERGVDRLRDALAPGITEQQLWSVLHQAVIAQGGDYIETRLLTSGERTNPWFQETSERVIRANELVALDTDVVGCFGYYADFSRTFHAGPDAPTPHQRELYALAHEQVHHNMSIIEPGLTFEEYSKRAWDIPARYEANRYYLSAHGVGMTGEYPYLYHRRDFAHSGYDGVFEPGMTVCVESFIGDEAGGEGVKLEQHCLVTTDGLEVLSRFPFEAALLPDAAPSRADLRLVATDPGGRCDAAGTAVEVDLADPRAGERSVRAAVRRGSADLEIFLTDPRWGDTTAAKIALRRIVEPARDNRVPVILRVDASDLDAETLVVIGHVACQVRVGTVRLVGGDHVQVAAVERGADGRLSVVPT